MLQLADDTALPNSSFEQLKASFEEILKYSSLKYMHINSNKTHLHISKDNTIITDIVIDNNIVITAAPKKSMHLPRHVVNQHK